MNNLIEKETMDKKKYIVPEEEILELKYQGMLCVSDPMQDDDEPQQGGSGGGLMP